MVIDIFSVGSGLSRLLLDLAAVASRVQLVDPYHGQAQHFFTLNRLTLRNFMAVISNRGYVQE
ncbi:hypothetical protein [Arsukibacterium sp.]|uniref:hypothetical protein n=1 Tax=Arsukibacterium sp. TaxID=1977258 RepID=UPI002FDADC95